MKPDRIQDTVKVFPNGQTEEVSETAMRTSEMPEARLSVDYDNPSTHVAIELLRKAGFRVWTTPVSDVIEPELYIGNMTYSGIRAIQDFVRKWPQAYAHQ